MQNGRNTDGKFSDGNAGRPKGSRNKATIAIESLLEGQAEALTQTAISKALDGDSIALRLCMDRIAPPMKDKPVWCCQTNENSHRIACAALIYALNSWRHSVRAAVRLILKLSRE